MTWLTDALANVPGYILIGAFALTCGLGLAWLLRGEEHWYLEDEHDYIVSSLYEFKKDDGR